MIQASFVPQSTGRVSAGTTAGNILGYGWDCTAPWQSLLFFMDHSAHAQCLTNGGACLIPTEQKKKDSAEISERFCTSVIDQDQTGKSLPNRTKI